MPLPLRMAFLFIHLDKLVWLGNVKVMKEFIKKLGVYKICIILITIAILLSAVFYIWDVYERQAYWNEQEPTRYQWGL